MLAHVWWSVYVRSGNISKVRAEHIPPIVASFEGDEFPWEVIRDDDSTGLVRLVNYQNLSGLNVESIIIPVLRRAYRLGAFVVD